MCTNKLTSEVMTRLVTLSRMCGGKSSRTTLRLCNYSVIILIMKKIEHVLVLRNERGE